MEYRILGPLEVLDDGEAVDLGYRQQRALLGLLLVNANRVVSTERIIEDLWTDDPAAKEKTLWVYISRLRTALEPDREARVPSRVLVTRDHGYRLVVAPEEVDSSRFEQAAEQGRRLVKDDPEAASLQLRTALDMWRGNALEDFTYEEFAQAEITRLSEMRVTAIEDRIDADIRRGLHRDVVGELTAFAREHSLRERPIELLMVALYRSGRQADALRAFERHRKTVGEELGIEPSPELRRVEEQVLLHDDRLEAPGSRMDTAASFEVANPFKGLKAFSEADVATFFGRDRLVTDLVRRLNGGSRLLTLVGASGSGKSSAVRAGLIPAIRKGAGGGSERWLIAQMVPGSRPFTELEAALLRSTLDAPDSLSDLLDHPDDGLLRAALRLLPEGSGKLVLVIDQFEELFILVESEAVRSRFIRNLETALGDPHGRITIVLTLRADFYDRPLRFARFGELLGGGVVNVVPLSPDELEAAAEQPAAIAGVRLEPKLLARLIGDVAGQSGGLPLFQYALTELFDRRAGDLLTASAYQDMGGLHGALTSRAESLYTALDPEEQGAAKQLFLRLVTITETGVWSRRRVAASEIIDLGVDMVALQSVLDRFGLLRLLTFDRDSVTGSPTVEVAHEALLHEWNRLREWIDEGRDDVLRHARLIAALDEWKAAGQKPDYLVTGERLERYERWAGVSTLQLSSDEQRFLDASVSFREDQLQIEELRTARESKLDKQARRRLWGLGVAATALAILAAGVVIVALAGRPPQIAMVRGAPGDSGINDLMIGGLATAESKSDIVTVEVQPLVDPRGDLRNLAETGADLVIVSSEYDIFVEQVAAEYPDVHFVAIDPFALHEERENVTAVSFAVEDSAYLAGAAAALTTKTNAVGFVGAPQVPAVEAARTGFEAGVAFIDRDITVMSTYVGPVRDPLAAAAARPDLAKELASEMYAADVDVIFHVAGASGSGVVEAAQELSTQGRRLWVIGSDVDEYRTVSAVERQHILASATKRYDSAVTEAVSAFLDGTLTGGSIVLGLAEGGVSLAQSGDYLSDVSGRMSNINGEVMTGHLGVTNLVLRSPQWQRQADVAIQLEMRSGACEIVAGPNPEADGTLGITPGSVVLFEYENRTTADAGLALRTVPSGTTHEAVVEQAKTGLPPSYELVLGASLVAPGASTSVAIVMIEALVVPNCFFVESTELPGDFPVMVLAPEVSE